MDWVLRGPQIQSTFGNLGFAHAGGYHINENCNAALETILQNILTEDKYLRAYRRNISFGNNIEKDLIPLLIHAKEDETVDLLIKIFVNLTIPIECLLPVEVISQNDFGRHTIYEINNLLASTKVAFTDHRATKVVIEFLKKNIDVDQPTMVSPQQCSNISNSLILLRNILHIPVESGATGPGHTTPGLSVQNQILWNIFSQSIDKILIKLMTIPEASNWGVTMVQLIALLYKDQHVVTLHKLLNMWLESALSDSSEDNESNTSPSDRGSESPMLTSDPTSDSSDTGGSGKCNDEPGSHTNGWGASSENNSNDAGNQLFQTPHDKHMHSDTNSTVGSLDNDNEDSAKGTAFNSTCTSERSNNKNNNNIKKTAISEVSDCGYGTQIENPELNSTSSNEDELPIIKPVHQKLHNPKQRIVNKARIGNVLQDRKRKKIVKRVKANIINVQGLTHKTPTDADIANVLKEFTVDFLLKGYNFLVKTLHSQILTNLQLEIDTSHFFWLVTYFLKFATQIELDLEHVSSVLSFEVVSYLTAEGVNLCEQFELAIKLDGNDLKPNTRRLHLVVTAIREFVQAIEMYKKFAHISDEDKEELNRLQVKMCETEELRSLLVLLLRHYNPKYHTKQYLQDLVVTNHILLVFVDSVLKTPGSKGSTDMVEHIKQFATLEIMYQYGLLLEDYTSNGEFVNDCVFTMMHHIGGELDCLIYLFQPKILKTFTSIWKSEFEICDDWADLIEYVINTFIKKPQSLQRAVNVRLEAESFFDEDVVMAAPPALPAAAAPPPATPALTAPSPADPAGKRTVAPGSSKDRWSEDELAALNWNYIQCNAMPDAIGEIIKLFKEDGAVKSRESVVRELFKQKLVSKEEYEKLLEGESDRITKRSLINKEMRDDEIAKLCEQLIKDGKGQFLTWVQRVLLDCCHVKIYLDNKASSRPKNDDPKGQFKSFTFGSLKKKAEVLPHMSPVSYHSLMLKQPVPLVPWNCQQAEVCKDLKFLQLLHKLGFQMPVDTGKVFIRIPHIWTADCLYEVAGKVLPIDTSKLEFSINDISGSSKLVLEEAFPHSADITEGLTIKPSPENYYQIHKQNHLATMINFTSMPGSAFSKGGEEDTDVNKQNWLDIIKKSQDFKIAINIESAMTQGDAEEMKNFVEVEPLFPPPPPLVPEPVPPLAAPAELSAPPLAADAALNELHDESHDAALDNTHFSMHISGSEDNNSECETASVASDLTRMYVSDEDEKPEVLRPILAPPPLDEPAAGQFDHDNAGKRARVQFSPTF